MSQPFEILQQHVYSLLESKLELAKTIEELNRAIVTLEGDTSSELNWSYLLHDLKLSLYDIDLNYALGFINEIDEQISDLPYKVRRAQQKMRTAVNPILRNTPVFFDASNQPEETDYLNPRDPEKKDV